MFGMTERCGCVYWIQQLLLCPFFIFSLDLGRYFSRNASCLELIAPLLFLEKIFNHRNKQSKKYILNISYLLSY